MQGRQHLRSSLQRSSRWSCRPSFTRSRDVTVRVPSFGWTLKSAVVLLVTYCASLVFTLKTHRQPHEHSGPPSRLSISQSMDAALSIAVLTISFVAHDGETHWMEGVQMLAVYDDSGAGVLLSSGRTVMI